MDLINLFYPIIVSYTVSSDFELSDAQYVHALSIEHLVPGLSDLKVQICSTDMTEACFWKIYFVLLHSKLNKQDAELLSTPQVLSWIIHSISISCDPFFFYIIMDFCAMPIARDERVSK
jgi:hypothetical protein